MLKQLLGLWSAKEKEGGPALRASMSIVFLRGIDQAARELSQYSQFAQSRKSAAYVSCQPRISPPQLSRGGGEPALSPVAGRVPRVLAPLMPVEVEWPAAYCFEPRKAASTDTPKILFACFPSSPRGQRCCVGFVSSHTAQVLACLFLSLEEDYSGNRAATNRLNFS